MILILASAIIGLSKFDIKNWNEGSFDKLVTQLRSWHQILKSSVAGPLVVSGQPSLTPEIFGYW